LLDVSGTEAVARVDYESTELNTTSGETVRVIFELLDWAWIRNTAGTEGWVPVATIRPV
jgi:SH3-like domain-containing protein